jgi:hypothetical protein
MSEAEAKRLVDTVDRERAAFIEKYFHREWPNRSLYPLPAQYRYRGRNRDSHDSEPEERPGTAIVIHARTRE